MGQRWGHGHDWSRRAGSRCRRPGSSTQLEQHPRRWPAACRRPTTVRRRMHSKVDLGWPMRSVCWDRDPFVCARPARCCHALVHCGVLGRPQKIHPVGTAAPSPAYPQKTLSCLTSEHPACPSTMKHRSCCTKLLPSRPPRAAAGDWKHLSRRAGAAWQAAAAAAAAVTPWLTTCRVGSWVQGSRHTIARGTPRAASLSS